MKLYTKQGDDGLTGLFGGTRVPKNDPRVAAYGEIDETNAAVGVALAICEDEDLKQQLIRLQSDLFTIGAELASPDAANDRRDIDCRSVSRIETWIDAASSEVPPLKSFVLPGGSTSAAALHLARTVCRRAERAVVGLSQQQTVREELIHYVNRLSDYLFAAARLVNYRERVCETRWPPSGE